MTKPIDPNIRAQFAAQDPSKTELHSGPILGINFAALIEEAREMNLTDAQTQTLLQAYLDVAVHYTLMGFGLHPAQLASERPDTEEKPELSDEILASSPDNMIQLQYDSEEVEADKLEPEGGGS